MTNANIVTIAGHPHDIRCPQNGRTDVTDCCKPMVAFTATQDAYKQMDEQRIGRKARCVDKCQHPADFVCDYEDGTSHCLECIAEKFWQLEDILSGKYNLHTLAGAIQTIAHPELFAVKYDPIEVARKALHGSQERRT